MDWLKAQIEKPCLETRARALARQRVLTKPCGSLGRLETLAVQLASLQKTQQPRVDSVSISVFAGDHGVAGEGVSAFPQSVTREMVRNFTQGRAAINVLARQVNADLEIVDTGMLEEDQANTGIINARSGPGTENIVESEAMTKAQLERALCAGREASERALNSGCDLFIGGEMGIGNTTVASALLCAALDATPAAVVGPGTGLNHSGILNKRRIVERALRRHGSTEKSPLFLLRSLGGYEIAALAGAYLRCAQLGIPVLIDGFITTVAALLSMKIQGQSAEWFIYGHLSQEPGHRLVLSTLKAEPLVDLSMRLGEGSGAALVVPILRAACALHWGMATFDEARVSSGFEMP